MESYVKLKDRKCFLGKYVKLKNYTITNWWVSLSKICHEWPNNAVTHECAQCMSELHYLVMSDIFLIMKLVN